MSVVSVKPPTKEGQEILSDPRGQLGLSSNAVTHWHLVPVEDWAEPGLTFKTQELPQRGLASPVIEGYLLEVLRCFLSSVATINYQPMTYLLLENVAHPSARRVSAHTTRAATTTRILRHDPPEESESSEEEEVELDYSDMKRRCRVKSPCMIGLKAPITPLTTYSNLFNQQYDIKSNHTTLGTRDVSRGV